MPFDPSLPLPNSPLESQVIRDQLQALFNLINSIVSVTAAQIDGVTTVNPIDPANVTASIVGGVLHLSFAIPRGNDGQQGMPGAPGNDGGPGPQGPPFANAIIDSVTTLPPGSAATVSIIFDGSNVRFTFGIPAGVDGAAGAPGEVSQAQLDAAIAGTSANTNGITTLDSVPGDPPTFADYEALRAKVNELILNGKRP